MKATWATPEINMINPHQHSTVQYVYYGFRHRFLGTDQLWGRTPILPSLEHLPPSFAVCRIHSSYKGIWDVALSVVSSLDYFPLNLTNCICSNLIQKNICRKNRWKCRVMKSIWKGKISAMSMERTLVLHGKMAHSFLLIT